MTVNYGRIEYRSIRVKQDGNNGQPEEYKTYRVGVDGVVSIAVIGFEVIEIEFDDLSTEIYPMPQARKKEPKKEQVPIEKISIINDIIERIGKFARRIIARQGH